MSKEGVVGEVGVGDLFALVGSSVNEIEPRLKEANFFELESHVEQVSRKFGQFYLQMISNLSALKKEVRKPPKCSCCGDKMSLQKKRSCSQCKHFVWVCKGSKPLLLLP